MKPAAKLSAYGKALALYPNGAAGDSRTPPGPELSFVAEVPSAGTYRLFVDFQHAGVVHTAELTVPASGGHGR